MSSSQTFTESSVYPIYASEKLLNAKGYDQCIQEIRDLIGIDAACFESFYQALIDRLVEFLQAQPDVGSSLNQFAFNAALRRAHSVLLQMMDSNIKRLDYDNLSFGSDLMAFAVFSSALLNDIGLLITDREIFLCNEMGEIERPWNYSDGQLYGQGDYFIIRYISQHPLDYGRSMTPIIANDLMPDIGLRWLSSCAELHHAWLRSLTGFDEAFGAFDMIFEIKKLHEKTAELGHMPVEIVDILYQSINEQFLKWLKQNIKNKTLSINKKDSAVHVTKKGILINKAKIIKAYKKSVPATKHPLIVASTNALGLSKLSGKDVWYDQQFGKKSGVLTKSGMYSAVKSDKTVKYSEKTKGILIAKKYLPGAPKEVSKYAIMPSIKQAIGEAMHQHERAIEHQLHADHGH